jgi:HAD superfamily phosphoserine phosphatase-like hydrolase
MSAIVTCDIDGTLWEGDSIFALFERYGKRERAEAVYGWSASAPEKIAAEYGMPVERVYPGIDVELILEEIVRENGPIEASVFEGMANEVRLLEGAEPLFAALAAQGIDAYLVSTAYEPFASALAMRLGIPAKNVIATKLAMQDGRATGFRGPVIEGERKEAQVRKLAQLTGIPLSRFVAIGDGAMDKWWLRAVAQEGGLAVAVSDNRNLVEYARPGLAMERPDFKAIIAEILKFAGGI